MSFTEEHLGSPTACGGGEMGWGRRRVVITSQPVHGECEAGVTESYPQLTRRGLAVDKSLDEVALFIGGSAGTVLRGRTAKASRQNFAAAG